MKKILGLDLGTNSIGWALISQDDETKEKEIIKIGSRIIPMSEDILGKFDSGITESDTAKRTGFRGVRRLRERNLLRRERLHRVLNILNFLPEHYANEIDFEIKLGQFNKETEPKIVYRFNEKIKQFEFLFKQSFEEMVEDFRKHQPQLLEGGKKIPYDWTIYYLRKKALTKRIEKEEIAWLLLNFNQKRGYYQLRGEEDEDATKTAKTRIYFTKEIITSIIDTGKKYKENRVLEVVLQSGAIGKIFKKDIPNWVGLEKNIIATVDIDKEGKDKYDDDKKLSQRFSIPTEADWDKEWKLIKIKTENDLNKSEKSVGTYIYDTLLNNPNQKINGKLVRVIERKFYKKELEQILETQQKFHAELQNKNLYTKCVEELYENNEPHKNSLDKKDIVHLFLNDIIFYQRPLKSKKSLISDCKFESRTFIKDGIKKSDAIKCIAKSHPLFQEFRLWQWLKNLRIYEKFSDVDVTANILTTTDDWVNLFDWLNDRKEVDHKAILNYLLKPIKLKPGNYRWNYVYDSLKDESKSYPCNETRSLILSKLSKIENIKSNFLSKEVEESLWHILYSVNDKLEIPKALKTFAKKYIPVDNLVDEQVDECVDAFVEQFKKFPPYKNEYGAYSAKAIKKLLPLMRMGKYWSEAAIHEQTKDRISKIITGEYDETIIDRVRDKAINLKEIEDFNGLPLWLTSYIVYDRHSEDGDIKKWKTPQELEAYLKEFKQHSLRNPIVEQIITETLRVVKDIWTIYGNSADNFFDEIHIELGRSMKNNKSDREYITTQMLENENTNLRIKALLAEMLNDIEVENVRPFSPSQQEILRIYEDGVLSSTTIVPDDILKISKTAQPSKNDLIRYKLWLEQKYRSPYTGAIIPLNKLFTTAYEIEHIIPQSRFFDDSFSNKVICETEVNKLKDNKLGLEFIKANRGQIVTLNYGQTVEILSIEAYEQTVNENYAKSRGKLKKLLLEDIPEKMVERQMNDTRYISKMVKNLLSNIVRAEIKDDGTTSVNVLSSNGQITSSLKQDWGLNDVWNSLIAPRFERLNKLTNSSNFGSINEKTQKFLPTVPLELSKGFTKKRIDHRHHALDALVIACATRNHINYLNNQNALEKGKNKDQKQKSREDLKHKLCYKKYNEGSDSNYKWAFKKPWETFTQDTKEQLLSTIVSFKQNLRVINKTVNKHEKWVVKNGIAEKITVTQTKGESWAIRKPMHKDTISGLVRLRFKKTVQLSAALDNWQDIVNADFRRLIKKLIDEKYDKKAMQKHFKACNNLWNDIDIAKVEIYYWDKENVASRVKLDESFNETKIESITDNSIQKILLNHLKSAKYQNIADEKGKAILPETMAFSPDGIDELNKNMQQLNNGKFHQPIFKVRTYEPKGNKFNVGNSGNKKDKFVEAAKGTNLFFAIYTDANGKRNYKTVPFNEVVESQKLSAGLKDKTTSVPAINENGDNLLFQLSPNDLVFIPTQVEIENPNLINLGKLNHDQINRIYKIVSFTGNRLYGIQNNISKAIIDKIEFSQLNKMETSLEKISIKEFCWKLSTNRLGIISIKQKV